LAVWAILVSFVAENGVAGWRVLTVCETEEATMYGQRGSDGKRVKLPVKIELVVVSEHDSIAVGRGEIVCDSSCFG
jgi:hypothetical protein